VAAVLVVPLAGCASMGLGQGPGTAYDLVAARDFPHRVGRAHGQLVVVEPTMLSPLDGERILVRPGPGQAAQLTDAQWEDRLPRLIQARLVQSFENANRLRAVGKPADKIAGDFVLITDVRSFEISASDGTAVVEIAAKIVREGSGRIVAARVIRATVPAQAMQGPGAVASINEAFVQAATQIVLWAAPLV
jgi:cholesterol transport system auxiliary component